MSPPAGGGTAPEAAPRRGTARGGTAGHGAALLLPLLAAACLDPGEATLDPALVTWLAYPDTVVAGEVFALEAAGPVTHDTCGRLDTLILTREDTLLRLSARRSVYRDAWCSRERVSFYEVRLVALERAGRYRLRIDGSPGAFPGPSPPGPGGIVVLDSGRFSPIRTRGVGTLRRAGGCLFFGPGWASNQRPFALRDAPARLEGVADGDTLVFVAGPLRGFLQCGGFGSRPSIRVEEARVLPWTGSDYYRDDRPGRETNVEDGEAG